MWQARCFDERRAHLYSWSPSLVLATADRCYVKAMKSKLLDSVEKDVEDPMIDSHPVDCVRVFDGMVIIQQLASIRLTTFG